VEKYCPKRVFSKVADGTITSQDILASVGLRISRNKRIAGWMMPRYSHFIDKLIWNRQWLDSLQTLDAVPRFPHRDGLHAFVGKKFGAGAIDYLEFGVYQGATVKMWSRANTHPDSRFFGFDSFEGLPEDWSPAMAKGAFTTSGKLPDIDDPRVRFVVGWFQKSLPGFLADFARRPNCPLIIHNDCDLFSSSLYCLATLNPMIQPGTIIIFDEFDDVLHEFRALTDYAKAFMREYRMVGAVENFCQVAVEITA
jgi:O-methyltransferase